MEEKICGSCGMPMRTKEEFGGQREGNDYCVHCCDTAGNLKSYADVLAGMTAFAVKMMGVTEAEAKATAIENMAKMPAWKDRS
ncbi:MAG: zinc ribbon domain-containing protein [Spirochaetes bacterium]|nr:zinc ribbon domain-containing protein [Spirochaetota bacterium]